MKARSRLFSLAMTTSELLPDSPLFSQTFFISSFRRSLNIHEHTHRSCAEGCVNLHAFEVAGMCMCPPWSKKRRRNYVGHTRACSKSVYWAVNPTSDTRIIHFDYMLEQL